MTDWIVRVRGHGCVVFWSLAEYTDLENLTIGLDGIGLGRFAPKPRKPASALRDALDKCVPENFMVRPLSDRNGFACVLEHRGRDENGYENVITVKIGVDDDLLFSRSPSYNPGGCDPLRLKDDILRLYRTRRSLVTASGLSCVLVRIAEAATGAVSLRPSGGVYWVNGCHTEIWRKVSEVLFASQVAGINSVYRICHEIDEDSAIAVYDAATRELLAEAERIEREIIEADLGERAIESRVTAAEAMICRLKVLEDTLGRPFNAVRAALEKARVAAGAGHMLVAAGADGPDRMAV